MDSERFKCVCSFDTETTNIETPDGWRAFPVCYIFDWFGNCDLYEYKPGYPGERVTIARHESEALEYIARLVLKGRRGRFVPVVCAYNLMFDMQTLMFSLSKSYDMRINSRSSTNAYTLDLVRGGVVVLRFWDMFNLEMRGLAAMGEAAGVPKASGDWDYTRVRTPDTLLADEERFYAARDVQVLPAYLRYLLRSHSWMKPEDLGVRVLTKTSIVRQMARHTIGPLSFATPRGSMTLARAFSLTCMQNLPKDYDTYALRRACFRGGLTFTAASTAAQVQTNVCSLDVTSMHHTFICGRFIPYAFSERAPRVLQSMAEQVCKIPPSHVLEMYHKPFTCAFHAAFEFTNIRSRAGSCFERWGVGLLAESKFSRNAPPSTDDPRDDAAEQGARSAGWHDTAVGAVFAYSKLISAERCTVHLSEVELWTVRQVYDWDGMRALRGEASIKFMRPPDYVTLQSCTLFDLKTQVKAVIKAYREGLPYTGELPEAMPDAMREALRAGTLPESDLQSFYTINIKGMFNGIYGTQAQDIYKPSYMVEDGEVLLDPATTCKAETWAEHQPKSCRVLYPYGLRIAGGSRMHLVIALLLLDEAFGDAVRPLGGDTDSIKAACAPSVTDAGLLEALKPLSDASARAIRHTLERVRRCFPEQASDLEGVGSFDVEDCGGSTRYIKHIELWNKSRVSLDARGRVHVTCAGLPQPRGRYNVGDWIEDRMREGAPFEDAAREALGYDVFIASDVCHSIEHRRPRARDVFDATVVDWRGDAAHVVAHEAVALYPAPRLLGDTLKRTNVENLMDLAARGLPVDRRERRVTRRRDGGPLLEVL